MEIISDLPIDSFSKVSKSPEIVPLNFRFWNWTKLSGTVVMRFLSVAIALSIVSIAEQSLALQKIGSNGSEVANIQSCLKKLGYFNGPVNGNFGSITQQAVIAFQQAKKLPADGVVGVGTQRSLQQACQSRTTNSNVNNNLRLGSRGPEVVKLQQRLQSLGYFPGPITGYFGTQTQQALIRSQQASRGRNNTVIRPRTPQQTSLNTPSQGGDYPLLSQGSQGPAVTRLQQRLQQLGYLNTNPTGNFGPLTRDALIAFQQNSGISANGITDQQTWNTLLNPSPGILSDRTSLSPEQVRELQERLREMGYLKATPTGNFGPMTRDALIRFQRDRQLAAEGIANIQALEAVRAVGQTTYTQPTRNYLTIGDSGDNVKAIQERLLQLGFFNGNPDGYYGENTRAYVYAFQQYSRLTPTGNVDAQTWDALGLNNSTGENTAVTNSNKKSYVVVVPLHNADTLNKVRQYIANPVVEKSRLGDYVNAGRFGDRSEAENLSKMLRSYGLDARVEYF